MMKLIKALEVRRWILEWIQIITRVLKIWKKEVKVQREMRRYCAAGFGGGGREHKPRDVGNLYKLGNKQGNIVSPKATRAI